MGPGRAAGEHQDRLKYAPIPASTGAPCKDGGRARLGKDGRSQQVLWAEGASPSRILDIGYAFWRSKALLSAVELDVFTILAEGPQHLGSLVGRVGIHERVRATSSMHSSRSACCIATERIDTATRPSAIAILIGASRPIPANC